MCNGIDYTLQTTRQAEIAFDIIFIVKIIVTFFSWEKTWGSLNKEDLRGALKKIALNYTL